MEKFLNILESPQPQQQQQDNFDAEKVRYISSKISIWNFFEIPEATTRNFSVPEKSKMFREYYARLCDKYYGSTGKKIIFFLVWPGCFYVCFFWCVFGLGPIFFFFLSFFWPSFLAQRLPSTEIDSVISQAVRDSNKISMSKNVFPDNTVETTITA